jgi:hypothetical protein
MFFGAFLPLMLVLVLGLLLAVIVVVREIRKIIGTSGETGSKNPLVLLKRESPAQELNKQHRQGEPGKQLRKNQSEGNSTGGAIWRW